MKTETIIITNSAGKNGIGPAKDVLVGTDGTAPTDWSATEGAASTHNQHHGQQRLLDALESGIRAVESDPEVHSVGPGSWPNMLGELELDAAIMNGTTLECGSVGAVKGFLHPISIARKVMEVLPHVCLVGEGASRFAAECGLEAGVTLTDKVTQKWREWLEENLSGAEKTKFPDCPLAPLAWKNADPLTLGTTLFLVRDGNGNIGSGVSTSGWSWKYPGRLGDSPIIGAGSYADSRYGAAGCIGHGELAVRTSAARSMVFSLKMGLSAEEACYEALRDIAYAKQGFKASLTLYVIDKRGNHFVAACGASPEDRYHLWREGMEGPTEKHPKRIFEWSEVRP